MQNRRLNIALVAQSPDLGGAEEYSFNLILEWVKKNHKIWVISDGKKYLDLFKNTNVITVRSYYTLDFTGNLKGLIKSFFILPFAFFFYLGILKRLKKEKLDIIFATNFADKLLVTLIAKILKVPIIWEEYGPLRPVFMKNFLIPKLLYKFICNFPEKIIVPSENTRMSLLEDIKLSKSRVKLIPCGIKIVNVIHIRKQKKKLVIGNVSRLTREKGQLYLIKAAPLILKKFPETKFVIVGEGPDREYFEKEIGKLNLKNNFEVTGFVKDKSKYYKSFDVFVFPTIWDLEGFGLVAVEAMSHKIPVVASRIGPVPEIVEDEKSGILIKPKSPEEIANAVIRLLKDEGLRRNMGENGLKKVKRFYDISKISGDILFLFEKSIRKREEKQNETS